MARWPPMPAQMVGDAHGHPGRLGGLHHPAPRRRRRVTIGFSTKTCLPAAMAWSDCSACRGVRRGDQGRRPSLGVGQQVGQVVVCRFPGALARCRRAKPRARARSRLSTLHSRKTAGRRKRRRQLGLGDASPSPSIAMLRGFGFIPISANRHHLDFDSEPTHQRQPGHGGPGRLPPAITSSQHLQNHAGVAHIGEVDPKRWPHPRNPSPRPEAWPRDSRACCAPGRGMSSPCASIPESHRALAGVDGGGKGGARPGP